MNLENKKQIAIILLAIGLGLVAAVLMSSHIKKSIQDERKRLAATIEKKSIKPLKRDLKRLEAEIVRLKNRPVVMARPGTTEKKKIRQVPKSSLALRTPSGTRAFTMRIDSLSAVGGLINPGDFIDIIGHLKMPQEGKKGKRNLTSIVFQNIQILAVGTNFQAPGGYKQQQKARALNVTVALSPREASLLSFIQQHGKLQFLLRGPSETETEIVQEASWKDFSDYIFESQGTELAVPRPKIKIEPVPTGEREEVKPFIEIFQGGKKQKSF